MAKKMFIAGLCSGAIGMDLLNCHLYRLGQVVHWIDVLALLLWPVLIWALFGAFKLSLIEGDMKDWIEERERRWKEKEGDTH